MALLSWRATTRQGRPRTSAGAHLHGVSTRRMRRTRACKNERPTRPRRTTRDGRVVGALVWSRALEARAIRALPHGHAAPRMVRAHVEACIGMLADASRVLRRARRPLRGVRFEVGFFITDWPRARTYREGAQRRSRACARRASTRIPCTIHGSYSLRESRLGLSAASEIRDCGRPWAS